VRRRQGWEGGVAPPRRRAAPAGAKRARRDEPGRRGRPPLRIRPGRGRGSLRVYDPATGRQVAKLECGDGGGHWNSPIVVDGRIALPEGNSNDHSTSGILDIWRLR